jgi:hypothetical protein
VANAQTAATAIQSLIAAVDPEDRLLGDPVQQRSERQRKSRCLAAGTAADSFHGAVGEERK